MYGGGFVFFNICVNTGIAKISGRSSSIIWQMRLPVVRKMPTKGQLKVGGYRETKGPKIGQLSAASLWSTRLNTKIVYRLPFYSINIPLNSSIFFFFRFFHLHLLYRVVTAEKHFLFSKMMPTHARIKSIIPRMWSF